jgi:hypothetical protein
MIGVLNILLSGVGVGIIGVLAFIIAMALLGVFLHWLSGVTNTKFVTRLGGSVIADNTAINRPNYVRVSKSNEQILLEEKLLADRIALRKTQNEITNNHRIREQEIKTSEENTIAKYEADLKKYEAELPLREEELKALEERLKNEKLSMEEKTLLELQKIGLNFNLKPLQPVLAKFRLPFNYYELHKKHSVERQHMRYEHSKLIEFDSEFAKMKFIELDSESDIIRTKLHDLNAKKK